MFLRGSSVPTVRRKSPSHARDLREQRVGLGGVFGRQVIAAPVHHGDAVAVHAVTHQIGGHEFRGHDQRGVRVAGPAQRRLVPRRAPGRGALGPAPPGHVVHRDDRRSVPPPGRQAGRPARPSARCRNPPARAPSHGPRPASGAVPEGATGRAGGPKRASGSAGALRERPPGVPAGQEADVDPVPLVPTLGQAAQQSPGCTCRCRRERPVVAARRPRAPSAGPGQRPRSSATSR